METGQTSYDACVINRFVRLRLSPPIYRMTLFSGEASSSVDVGKSASWRECSVRCFPDDEGWAVRGTGVCSIRVEEETLLLSVVMTASKAWIVKTLGRCVQMHLYVPT